MLKKIRRTLAMQGLLLSAMAWFGWKNRDAIERSVRAARAAWDEVGGEPSGPLIEEVVVAAIVVPESAEGADRFPGGEPSAGDAPYREPDVARPGF